MYFGGNIQSYVHGNVNFEEKSTRRQFITKVCCILAFQMLITVVVCSIFIFVEPANEWLRDHVWIVFIALGLYLILSLVLMCCIQVARQVPINYILLIVCTLCQSIMVSVGCMKYDYDKILTAVGVTLAVCVTLALFAAFAPCDFTGCGPFLCILMLVIALLGIASVFIRNRTLDWIFVCAGLLVICLYLVYDIQLMVGGHKNQYDEEDYIIAALCLYIDIIQMFLFILMLLGLIDSE